MKYFSLFAIVCILAGCSQRETASIDKASVDKLFTESIELLISSTDSLKIVNDSLTFSNIIKSYDDKITKINYQFAPDTFLGLSEAQNDSLIKLLDVFLHEKEKAYKRINTVVECIGDSI